MARRISGAAARQVFESEGDEKRYRLRSFDRGAGKGYVMYSIGESEET